MFAFTLKDEIDNFTVFDVSNALRERGWQVPAYTFPGTAPTSRRCGWSSGRGFTHDMGDLLIDDLERQLPRLEAQPEPVHDASQPPGSTTEPSPA